jgi:hypothetical protein
MGEGISNLNVWLDRLTSLYPDKEFISTYVQQLTKTTQHKDERVSMYLTRLGEVWNKAHPRRAPIRDSEFVELFVKGLSPKLRKEVGKKGDHKELLGALNTARETERVQWRVKSLEDVAKQDNNKDKKSVVCRFFAKGDCKKGATCPYKHEKANVGRVKGAAPPAPPPPIPWTRPGYVPLTQPWGQINPIVAARVPGNYACTLVECIGKPPHQYVDCKAGSRECKKCKGRGHHQARCPNERCESCGKRGVATWLCCGRIREGESDRERDRTEEERGARGRGRGGKPGNGRR